MYPQEMVEYVDRKSKEEGLDTSRLPHFDIFWAPQVRGNVYITYKMHFVKNALYNVFKNG
jgi:hypothetical protein